MGEKNVIIELLRKIFNLKVITVISSLIATAVTIYTVWPESKIKRLSNDIDSKCSVIENTFHPEMFSDESLTNTEISLLKNLQDSTLLLAVSWKSLKSLPSMDDIELLDNKKYWNSVQSLMESYTGFFNLYTDVIMLVARMRAHGLINDIKEYRQNDAKYYLFAERALKEAAEHDSIKHIVTNILDIQKEDLIRIKNQAEEQLKNGAETITIEKMNEKKRLRREVIGLYQAHYIKNEDFYDFADKLFSYLIELNSSCMLYYQRTNK